MQHPDGRLSSGEKLVRLSAKAARGASRPAMSESLVSASGIFRVHYDLQGDNAVSMTDADRDGVPDWPQLVAHLLDSVYALYREWGYTNSIADGGEGGGAEYDLYVRELSSYYVYGYTYYGSDGYMEIDDDYAERIYANAGEQGLRVTVGHELFHVIQFTYYDGVEARWWQEATATFMEEKLFPQINDYLQYLDPDIFEGTFFEDPSLSLDRFGTGVHPYGAALFPQFLTLRKPCCGMDAILRTFQEQQRQRSGHVAVIIRALEDGMGRDIDDLLAEFWVWSYFTAYRAREGFSFPDGPSFPNAPPSGIDPEEWVIEGLAARRSPTRRVSTQRLGAWIVRFASDGSEGGLELSVSGSGEWSFLAAAATPGGVVYFEPDGDHIEVPNWSDYDDIILVSANGDLSTGGHSFSFSAEYVSSLTRPTPADTRVTLLQNRPNPFNGGTEIPFTLDAEGRVTLRVYDALGRQVRTLLTNRRFESGVQSADWDGMTELGIPAATGVYLVRGTTGTSSSTIRVIVAR